MYFIKYLINKDETSLLCSIYEKIKLNDGEQRQLVDNIFKQSSTSFDSYVFCGDFGVSNKHNIINLSIF